MQQTSRCVEVTLGVRFSNFETARAVKCSGAHSE